MVGASTASMFRQDADSQARRHPLLDREDMSPRSRDRKTQPAIRRAPRASIPSGSRDVDPRGKAADPSSRPPSNAPTRARHARRIASRRFRSEPGFSPHSRPCSRASDNEIPARRHRPGAPGRLANGETERSTQDGPNRPWPVWPESTPADHRNSRPLTKNPEEPERSSRPLQGARETSGGAMFRQGVRHSPKLEKNGPPPWRVNLKKTGSRESWIRSSPSFPPPERAKTRRSPV